METIEELRDHVEAAERLLDERESEIVLAAEFGQRLLEKNKELQASYDALEKKNSQSVSRFEEEIEVLSKQNDRLMLENSDLEKKYSGITDECTDWKMKAERLMESAEELSSELSRTRISARECSKLDRELSEVKERCQGYKRELESLRKKSVRHQYDTDLIISERDSLKRSNETSELTIQKLKSDRDDLEERARELGAEKDHADALERELKEVKLENLKIRVDVEKQIQRANLANMLDVVQEAQGTSWSKEEDEEEAEESAAHVFEQRSSLSPLYRKAHEHSREDNETMEKPMKEEELFHEENAEDSLTPTRLGFLKNVEALAKELDISRESSDSKVNIDKKTVPVTVRGTGLFAEPSGKRCTFANVKSGSGINIFMPFSQNLR